MAVLLCFYTGLRLGELCALKWEDIDFERKLIRLIRTVERLYVEGHKTKTILLEAAPKSAYSRREIPLSNVILKQLCKLRRETDTGYVFGGKKPMEPRTLQYHFKKLLQEAGLPEKNFHILRHTFATNCIEGGTDVKSLSDLLGHSEVQITLNRYVHPSMETKTSGYAVFVLWSDLWSSKLEESLNCLMFRLFFAEEKNLRKIKNVRQIDAGRFFIGYIILKFFIINIINISILYYKFYYLPIYQNNPLPDKININFPLENLQIG